MYETKLYFDGEKPHIQNKQALIKWLSQLGEDSGYNLTLTPIKELEVNSQSRLYFKWCDIMAVDFGWNSSKEMHEYLKDTYNGGQSTKGFDKREWADYMNKVQSFAHENDIKLPTGKIE